MYILLLFLIIIFQSRNSNYHFINSTITLIDWSHNKISAAVPPLSKVLNPTLLQGDWPLPSLINGRFG